MSGIDPIFKDPKLQEEFDEKGYVKINLLTAEKTNRLYNSYMRNKAAHDTIASRYQATTHTNNPNLILEINQEIKSVVLPELDLYFQNFVPMMCTYITKLPGEGSETKLHQDPTFVDETKFVSANIWIALHDINHENGNLFFVDGTHRLMPSLRVTPNCPTAYDSVKDELVKHLTEVAALMAGYPKAAELLMLFQNPINQELLQTYSMNKEAFLHFIKGKPPVLGKLKAEKNTYLNQSQLKNLSSFCPKKHQLSSNSLISY